MIKIIATPFAINDIYAYKAAGADGVEIAVPFFSARGAAYFEAQQLQEIKDVCEQVGMRMFVKVNRFFVDEELKRLRAFLHLLKQIDVDGIYYGDECVLYEAKQLDMVHKLIYAPDTLITNHEDAVYYLQEGIAHVSISREITLDDICAIAQATNGQIEVLIHGRVNMMHSKRMLLSNYLSFIGNDTAIKNKHSLYIMEETREEHMPIIEDELGTHVFSGYTLASFEEILNMAASGVQYVKIDGIFHDAAYVCEAITYYRLILNGAYAKQISLQYKETYAQDHVTSGFYYQRTSKHKIGETYE